MLSTFYVCYLYSNAIQNVFTLESLHYEPWSIVFAIMATILHKQMIEQMIFAVNGGKMVQKKVYKLNYETAQYYYILCMFRINLIGSSLDNITLYFRQ